jgi:peptidoglycan/xylan/chitin deacetylase (PgdA/CDA1 family)
MVKRTNIHKSVLRLFNPLGSIFLPGGSNAKLLILIYHRILTDYDPFRPDEPTTQLFEQQMQLLANNFHVLKLTDAIDRLHKGTLPPRSACITFDDGYTDNLTLGVEILRRYSLTATFFLTNGFVENGIMWNDIIIEAIRNTEKPCLNLEKIGLKEYKLETVDDKCTSVNHIIYNLKYVPLQERLDKVNHIVEISQAELPNNLMMTSKQIKLLYDSGMEIGGHTVSHPILARIDNQTAQQEIMENKIFLETTIKDKVNVFAYPNGRPGQDYTQEHVKLVKKLGFTSAVSTSWGAAISTCDSFQLPRFTPWDKSSTRFLLRLYQNATRNLPDQLMKN